jgi:hypothetical protein
VWRGLEHGPLREDVGVVAVVAICGGGIVTGDLGVAPPSLAHVHSLMIQIHRLLHPLEVTEEVENIDANSNVFTVHTDLFPTLESPSQKQKIKHKTQKIKYKTQKINIKCKTKTKN